jgi:DNA polymerase III alpha subunit (gram-positive type)
MVRLIDLCTGKKRRAYGLGALQKAFGVTKAQAHRADGDVKMTKELFEKLIAVLKGPICEAFMDSY